MLAEIGFAGALLARETPDGLELIDGHLLAETTPDMQVPVLVLDVDEAEARVRPPPEPALPILPLLVAP